MKTILVTVFIFFPVDTEKEGVCNMLSTKDFFQKLFTLPTGLYIAILVGLLVGGGSTGRYLSYRTKRTLEAVGFQSRRYPTAWLFLGNVFVVAGLLLVSKMGFSCMLLSEYSILLLSRVRSGGTGSGMEVAFSVLNVIHVSLPRGVSTDMQARIGMRTVLRTRKRIRYT